MSSKALNTYQADSIKPVVIYHANCADGFSAAWCFWHVFKDAVEYYPGVYSQNPPENLKYRQVYLVDFSYKAAVVHSLLNAQNRVVLIDHHITAIEDLKQFLQNAKFSMHCSIERSGAVLAWDYLRNVLQAPLQEPPLLLAAVEDRDLWKFKLPLTREISANIFSHEYTFENWDKLMALDYSDLPQFAKAGEAIERKHHKDIKELVEVMFYYREIAGILVPVCNLPMVFTSDAGHLMASRWQGGKAFAACYWDIPGSRQYSLRSTENGMDVSLIAKLYGGGGHKNAAGFVIPVDHELARS